MDSTKDDEKEIDFTYTYKEFIEEGKKLCEKTNNLFKFCLNELLDISYIQGNLNISKDIILELDILFSEVYSLPVMYFQIYKNGIPYNFDIYIKENPSVNENIIKSAIISKENHPLTGKVYNFMHLCKFNFLMKSIKIDNILYFWLSLILQIFNFDIMEVIDIKNK